MTLRAIAVLILAIAFAVTPFLVPFDGFNPALYPNPQPDPPILPAGYAFSLWGVIYLWCLLLAVLGVLKYRDYVPWDVPRWGLIISLMAGVPWLSVAEASPLWSTPLIWVMLLSALWALSRTTYEYEWTLGGPIGLYAGWLTAASSVAVGLTGYGWGLLPLSQEGWAILALLLALSVASLMIWLRPALTYGFAVCWALVAVMVRNDFAGAVALLAGAGVAVVAIWTILCWRKVR